MGEVNDGKNKTGSSFVRVGEVSLLRGAVETAIKIANERNKILEQLRNSILRKNSDEILKYSSMLCGLTDVKLEDK